ncbi:YueI family protein [Pediococcus siamensis]|uniref:YueI family protein n=1 Tax=Pediococcus siamensis TaxID=381829 RepID=UPI0039A2633A
MPKDNEVDSRLQNAIHGTPKLNPDEQRHYLGTFRERVACTMTVAEIKSAHYQTAFINQMKQYPNAQLFINGNLNAADTQPYLRAANELNLKFTIKTDQIYGTDEQQLALVLAAPQSLNIAEVDVTHFVPEKKTDQPPKPKSLLSKLKDILK